MKTLDLYTNPEAKTKPITPAWKVLGKTDKQVVTWFEETLPLVEELSEYRISCHVNNLLWYTGEYDRSLEYRAVIPGQSNRPIPRQILPRIFSHLFDITEQRVSKLSGFKPDFDVVPTNREQKDRQIARLIKPALDALKRRVHMDFLMQEVERWNCVFGEELISVEWNPHIGDKVSADSLERVGDVDIKLKEPWRYLPEPKTRWEDVNWVIELWDIMHVEEVRKKWKIPSLQPDGKKNIFSFNSDVDEKREEELVIYRITHKPSEFLPSGNMTYIANNTVLEVLDKYPYSHGEFPFERHTDIDVPGRLFPISFYQHLKPIQHVHNRLTSIMVRNALLVGHPHILMPKGAAKLEAFGNKPTAIEFSGTIKPEIVTFNSIPQEFFALRREVREEMNMISGIQGVSRGAPPPGARAASILRFYEEQEQQRASTQIIKHNELIRRIYLKAASVIAEYYPGSSKERLIRVVGKENEYDIQAFIGTKISSEYDVIIINSTGFSESKAARMEEVQAITQMAPGLLSPQQIADILEIGAVQKMYDITTSAIKQAEAENERFLSGQKVQSPQKYQDLIAHWRTHMILLNTSTWEENVSFGDKEAMNDHMRATEMLMEEKAKINPAFAAELQMLRGYPAFWTPTPAPPKEAMPSNDSLNPMPMEEQMPQSEPEASGLESLLQAGPEVESALGEIPQIGGLPQ